MHHRRMVETGSWRPDGAREARWVRMRSRFGDARLDRVGAVAALGAVVTGVGMGFVSLAVPASDPLAVGRFTALEVVLAVLWTSVPASVGASLGLDPVRRLVTALLGGTGLALAAGSWAGEDPLVPPLTAAGASVLAIGAAWWLLARRMTTAARRVGWTAVAGMHGATGLVVIGVGRLGVGPGDALVLVAGAFVWLGLGQAAVLAIRAQVVD